MSKIEIKPAPSNEEAAAIAAALSMLEERREPVAAVSRWRLSGRDWGCPVSLGMTNGDREALSR